jgi:hypothetical protein
MLAGLLVATVNGLTEMPSLCPSLVNIRKGNSSMAALQVLTVSRGIRWVHNGLEKTWCPLIGPCNGAAQLGIPRRSTVTRDSANRPCCKDSNKQKLEDWQMLSDEAVASVPSSNESSERAAELVCNITELIDSCEGLMCAESNGLVAMLGYYKIVDNWAQQD